MANTPINNMETNYKRITEDNAKTAMYVHLNNNNEATGFILMLIDAKDNNCMGGYTLDDISSAYYLNGWVFYQLKGSDEFEVFAYDNYVSTTDIKEIEKIILSETN